MQLRWKLRTLEEMSKQTHEEQQCTKPSFGLFCFQFEVFQINPDSKLKRDFMPPRSEAISIELFFPFYRLCLLSLLILYKHRSSTREKKQQLNGTHPSCCPRHFARAARRFAGAATHA